MELYEDIYKKKEAFSFGKNWVRFLNEIDDHKINLAKQSLVNFVGAQNLSGKTFIDIGSGSGLFSLSAILLGAKKVISIDADEFSVQCATQLRRVRSIGDQKWCIQKGSILDKDMIKNLGQHDIVYSWGVLHHTGDMERALENITHLVKSEGLLYIAIYNDSQNLFPTSRQWKSIKKFYIKSSSFVKRVVEIVYFMYTFLGLIAHGVNPVKYVREYEVESTRGMSFYSDIRDWLGGYPYEYAHVGQIVDFYKKRGYGIVKVNPNKNTGCNEFLFKRTE